MEQNISQQPNFPTQQTALPEQVEQILLSINHHPSAPSDWPHLHPNYQHIHSFDDVMSEPDPQPIPQTSSVPQLNLHHQYVFRPVPPQPSSSVTHHFDNTSHSHHPSSNNFPPPHTPPSQRLPPRAPTPRLHPSPSQSYHLTPPQPLPHQTIAHQTVTTTESFSPVEHSHPAFALPQTIAGSYATKQESVPSNTLTQYFTSTDHHHALSPPISYNSQPDQIPVSTHSHPKITHHIDPEKYVRESAFTAETVKVAYRDRLKKDQLAKENAAKSRGSPMTAKEKERERSRRESAVTRKRAEIYIKELEKVSRRLPWMEMRLTALENELQRLTTNVPDFDQRSAHSQIGHMPPTSIHQIVKSEPCVHLSPASQRTSTVMNQMQQLDLRLQNASESG